MAKVMVLGSSREPGRTLEQWLGSRGHVVDRLRPSSMDRILDRTVWPDLSILALTPEEYTSPEISALVDRLILHAPILAVVQGVSEHEIERDLPGLADFLAAPISEDRFLGRVEALLRVQETIFRSRTRGNAAVETTDPSRSPARVTRESGRQGLLDSLRECASPRRSNRAETVRGPYPETLGSLVLTAEWRDAIDPGHGRRVASLCAIAAAALGLDHERRALLVSVAAVHDVGKAALPPGLLRKPVLDEIDQDLVRTHPKRSAQIIRALTGKTEAAEIVLHHHERPDGRGYYGLSAEDVHPLSRILAVADAYDGLTSRHARGPVLTPAQAIEALRSERGAAYDRASVDGLTNAVLRGAPAEYAVIAPIATRAYTTGPRLV